MQTAISDILKAFDQSNPIIIQRHVHPDADAIGSQIGLATILKNAYPQKQIYAAGDPAPEFSWIGEQQQVPEKLYQGALVVVIDTANTARIAGKAFTKGAQLMKIDHHPDREPFGDLSYVNTQASCASEIVFDLVQASARLNLTKKAAACLYAGIIGDTGRFLYDLTNPHTHEAAASLMRLGIDAPAIGRKEEELDGNTASLIASAFAKVAITKNGAANFLVSQDLLRQYRLNENQAQAVVTYLGKLRQIKAWVVFFERADNAYRVEFRSKVVPISALAVRHGGGGHPLASGAIAHSRQEMQMICTELDALLKASSRN